MSQNTQWEGGASLSMFYVPSRCHAAKTKICYPWTQESEVSKDNHFPITGVPQAVIDCNYHRQQLFQLKQYHEQQLCHLNNLPEIIVDAVVPKLDEREMPFARLREKLRSLLEEELKALNIIPSPKSLRS